MDDTSGFCHFWRRCRWGKMIQTWSWCSPAFAEHRIRDMKITGLHFCFVIASTLITHDLFSEGHILEVLPASTSELQFWTALVSEIIGNRIYSISVSFEKSHAHARMLVQVSLDASRRVMHREHTNMSSFSTSLGSHASSCSTQLHWKHWQWSNN